MTARKDSGNDEVSAMENTVENIIEDMMLGEEQDHIRKTCEKAVNEYQQAELRRENNKNIIPFPDYLVGWNLQSLLFVEGKKWRTIMLKTMKAMAKRFGLKQSDIRDRCIGLMEDMLPFARMNTLKREEREANDDLDAISSSDDTRWRFMEILGGLNCYLEANVEPKAPIVAVSVKAVCADTRRWDIVRRYYRVVDKQIRSLEKEKIADLRQSEPLIRKRQQDMKEVTEYLRPKLIKNRDKRKLWTIICNEMPGFNEFLLQLGESSKWKTCFASASRCAMIAAVDDFYHEFEIAIKCIARELGLEDEELTVELHKNQDKDNCFVSIGDEVIVTQKNNEKIQGTVMIMDMKVEKKTKYPGIHPYIQIKANAGKKEEQNYDVWTENIASVKVLRFKGE